MCVSIKYIFILKKLQSCNKTSTISANVHGSEERRKGIGLVIGGLPVHGLSCP